MIVFPKNYSKAKSDKNYLKPIKSLKSYIDKELRDYLRDFLIHGSISTADYSIGWSDFDTFVIFDNSYLKFLI